MIRVLIADDHSVVRQGLIRIISESPEMVVAGEAGDGQEVLDNIRAKDCDVLILDIAMPGRGGIEILKDIKREKPDVKVMIFSIYAEEQYAIRVLRDGASAYLTKGCTPDELLMAIKTVARGKRYITPSVADKLATYVDESSHKPPHELLSDREMEVLVMIGSGKRVKQIAKELSLSVKTVSTYRVRILEKTGLQSTAQLIRYAILHNLIE